jgi:hypothetical protein
VDTASPLCSTWALVLDLILWVTFIGALSRP